jgi:hypothetical protein
MSDAPTVAAYILESLSDLLEAHWANWRIQIGWSYIEPRDESVYVCKITSDKNFSLADPECAKQIKEYLLEHEDYVLFEFPGSDWDPWKGAIDRVKLNDIVQRIDIDWPEKINAIRCACKPCEFPLNAEWMLDDDDKDLWDEFVKEYRSQM